MNRRDILQDLTAAGTAPVSGQTLAEKYGVSRNAVWKAVRALQRDGYPVSAVGKKGYILQPGADILSEDEIRPLLGEASADMDIRIFRTIDSTNAEARRMVHAGCSGECMILTDTQTKGRGRAGHVFYSPPLTGLYFTLLLRPGACIGEMAHVSHAAGIAVCQAVLDLTGIRLQIRSVNDLYLGPRKVGGILSEAFSEDLESRQISGLVIGIGINLTTEIFPDTLKDRASSLMTRVPRSQLAAAITNRYKEIELSDAESLGELYAVWHS